MIQQDLFWRRGKLWIGKTDQRMFLLKQQKEKLMMFGNDFMNGKM